MEKIAVIGAGQMGNGIAQVAASAGYEVLMIDIKEEYVDRGMATIQKSLSKLVSKERVSQSEADDTLARISTTTDRGECADVDLVVEAVPEILDLKTSIFSELDEICKPECILASNTSSISISTIANATNRPEKVIGMHFFNPVPVMKLVEVIRGLATSDATLDATLRLAESMGKTPVPANDRAGFVSNRVLMPLINEAFFAWMEGVAEPEHIDEIMKLGCAHPMGPLRLADFIGLDVCHDIMMVLYRELGDSKFFPCPLLRQLVTAGRLGDKTGHGVYNHSEG